MVNDILHFVFVVLQRLFCLWSPSNEDLELLSVVHFMISVDRTLLAQSHKRVHDLHDVAREGLLACLREFVLWILQVDLFDAGA